MKALTASLAAGFLAFAPLVADAGFTVSRSITEAGRSKHLEDGTIYTISSDLEFRALSSTSAFYMDANSTSVLYIATGSTLNLTGGSGSGMTGAGAGIEIPASSVLIITGGGTIKATGAPAVPA